MTMAALLFFILGSLAGSAFPQPSGEIDLGLFKRQQLLYHSAAILSHDYGEMLDRFRLFVYPPLKNNTKVDLRAAAGSDGVDRVFFDSLVSSGFVTDDPEAADMFLVPASVSALWSSAGGPSAGDRSVARALRSYIQQLRDSYPYWQRTLAADHVFISCRGIKSDWSRNVLELQKNAVQIACFPLQQDQEFFPHKDITLPSHSSDAINSAEEEERVHLALHATDDPILRSDSSFVALVNESADDRLLLLSSRFCISLGGGDRQLIIDALRSGCIPVIFATGSMSDLPFQDILDWNQFALILRRDQLSELHSILESTDEKELVRLRHNGKLAVRHMQWHIPPLAHDAFYMSLYQLWRRHYVVRYVDRTAM